MPPIECDRGVILTFNIGTHLRPRMHRVDGLNKINIEDKRGF